MKTILVATAVLCSFDCAHAEADQDILIKMQRTISLFECGNLVGTKAERRPFLESGMKSGREFLNAIQADSGLYSRIWGKVDFVLFYDSPTVDFQLGAAYAAIGDRISK